MQVLAWKIVHLDCLNFCFHPRCLTSVSRIVQVLAWRIVHLDCLKCCFHLQCLISVSRIVQVLAWFRFTKPRFLTTVSRIVQVAAWIRSTKTRCLATVSRIVQVVAWIKSTKHLLTTISRIAHLDRPQLLIHLRFWRTFSEDHAGSGLEDRAP